MSRRVTGIGGIFFRSSSGSELAKWYERHFGIPAVGGSDLWRQEEGPTVFAPFKMDSAYFGRMEQQFMINFRVHDLPAFLEELKSAGVKSEGEMVEESYGRFAWVYDPEDNKIELWEPAG
jgi:glyoxylase I family protein